MSKVTIQGDASGTGIFTIASPNSNTDRTLVLPDEAGTVLTTAGVPASAMPAGSVIQVVNFTTASEVETTSGSLIDTGLQASITPSSSTNKILVIVTASIYTSEIGTDSGVKLGLLRNGSSIINTYFLNYGLWNNVEQRARGGCSVTKLDSPASTSSVTYKLQIASSAGGRRVGINHDASTSTITLMEIAA